MKATYPPLRVVVVLNTNPRSGIDPTGWRSEQICKEFLASNAETRLLLNGPPDISNTLYGRTLETSGSDSSDWWKANRGEIFVFCGDGSDNRAVLLCRKSCGLWPPTGPPQDYPAPPAGLRQLNANSSPEKPNSYQVPRIEGNRPVARIMATASGHSHAIRKRHMPKASGDSPVVVSSRFLSAFHPMKIDVSSAPTGSITLPVNPSTVSRMSVSANRLQKLSGRTSAHTL